MHLIAYCVLLQGTRQFVFKEDLSTLDQARQHANKMFWLEKICQVLFIFIFVILYDIFLAFGHSSYSQAAVMDISLRQRFRIFEWRFVIKIFMTSDCFRHFLWGISRFLIFQRLVGKGRAKKIAPIDINYGCM